jgi:hypothetical protein
LRSFGLFALVLSLAGAGEAAQTVTGFALINAETGTVIPGYEDIADGATINLRSLPTRNLSVRASTSPAVVGSVQFGYDADPSFRVENTAPYALAGDRDGDYYPWTPTLGLHTVTATPYSEANAAGIRGITTIRRFHVTDDSGPGVQSFTLVDADTGLPVPGHDPLPSAINLATLPTRRLNIRANTSPAIVGSVQFGYDGNPSFRVENAAPYALAGNTGAVYNAWTPTVGSHVVTATPFTEANAIGSAGGALIQPFVVADDTASEPSPRPPPAGGGRTVVGIEGRRFSLNGTVTYPGAAAEGRLMNVRMVNAVFEDTTRSSFDPEANTDEFLAAMPDYVAAGVRAFTISLQGGNPSYEGAVNTAFTATGALKSAYMARVKRVIDAADAHGAVIILTLFYQRQDQHLANETAVRNAVVSTVRWVAENGFANVLVEIANEHTHTGFDHAVIRTVSGMVSLIRLAKETAPSLYVSTSGYGDGLIAADVARAADYILLHTNSVSIGDYDDRIARAAIYGTPVLITEDPKTGSTGASAARTAVRHGASWGLFLRRNQAYPFTFEGTADDPVVYDAIRELTAGD